MIELGHEHSVGGLGILIGTVGLEIVLHLAAAVELIGGGEIATLQLLEDGAGIDEAAPGEVEVDAGTQELLCQQGHVEIVGVEAREVAALELVGQGLGNLAEGGLVLDIIVGNTR